jgi:hypothetical protein
MRIDLGFFGLSGLLLVLDMGLLKKLLKLSAWITIFVVYLLNEFGMNS